MALLKAANVEEYRQMYGEALAEREKELGKEITDEMLTEAIYKKLSGKADIDYYAFYKAFNPKGKYSNLATYRTEIDDNESNDTDIINRAYEELQANGKVRFKDFVNVFAPKDFDKEKYLEDLTFSFDIPKMPDTEYTIEEIAEMRGIDPNTDVNLAEVGFAQALARDEEDKALAAKTVLSNYFNQDVPIRYGQETEELEFLNPQSGKYELVNAYGLDSGDLAKFGTFGAFIIPEILATTFAAGATGPTGAVITSAASSAILETARLALGNELYGINKTEEGFTDYLKNEGKDMAVLNAALTQAGITIPKLYRMVKDLRRFGKINASEFGGKIKDAEQANKLMMEINDRLVQLGSKRKLKFTLGQASDDPELLALQNAYETNPKYGVKGTFDEFNKKQAEALDVYMNLMSDQYNFASLSGKNNIASDELGEMIQETIVKRLSPKQKKLTANLESAQTDLTEAIIKFPDGSAKEAGDRIRSVIDDLYDDFEESYSKKYTALFETGKGRKINTDIIRSAVKDLNKRQRETLFKKYPSIATFFKLPKGSKVNINTLKNTLSDLRRFDREIQKGIVPVEGSPVEGSVSKLIGSIKDQFAQDLGTDDVWYREFLKLDKAYKKNKDLYRGTIAKIIATKNGRPVIAGEDIFKQTFKKGSGQITRIDDVYNILKKRPSLITDYKNQILGAYKQAVDPNNTGKVNLVAHQRFLNDYSYALEKFFGGKAGAKKLETIGALAKNVEAATLKRDKIMKQLGKSTEGKIEAMDPDKIFQFLYNNKSPTTLNKVMTIIRQDKDLLNAFQTVAKDDLLFKVTDNRGKFSFNNFANYLKENKNILDRTFADNPQFIKDLENMRDALEITTRTSTQKTIGKAETALNDIIRARLGQFTVAGRTFTALKKIVRSDVDRQLAEIITDPKRLQELLDLKNVPKDSKLAKQTITRLFGYYIFDEKFFEDDQYTPTMIDIVDAQQVNQAVRQGSPIEEETPQEEVIQTAALPPEIPAPASTGLEGIQARQNYESLFPDDTLGAALAKRGTA